MLTKQLHNFLKRRRPGPHSMNAAEILTNDLHSRGPRLWQVLSLADLHDFDLRLTTSQCSVRSTCRNSQLTKSAEDIERAILSVPNINRFHVGRRLLIFFEEHGTVG